MHEEIVIGMSHFIEDEKACKDESHILHSQSIEQQSKTHEVQDDIYVAAVVFPPEKLRVLEKFRHVSSDEAPSSRALSNAA
jgi:hypothetical protein